METNLTKISNLSKATAAKEVMLGLIMIAVIIWKIGEGIAYLPGFLTMYNFYIMYSWFTSVDQEKRYIHIHTLVSNHLALAIIASFGATKYDSVSLIIDLLILYFAYQDTVKVERRTKTQSERRELTKIVIRSTLLWPIVVLAAIMVHKLM